MHSKFPLPRGTSWWPYYLPFSLRAACDWLQQQTHPYLMNSSRLYHEKFLCDSRVFCWNGWIVWHTKITFFWMVSGWGSCSSNIGCSAPDKSGGRISAKISRNCSYKSFVRADTTARTRDSLSSAKQQNGFCTCVDLSTVVLEQNDTNGWKFCHKRLLQRSPGHIETQQSWNNLAELSDLAKYLAACLPPGQLLERFLALKDEILASNHPKAQGYCSLTTMTHFCFPKQSTSHAMQ